MATFSQDFKPISFQDIYADASIRKADGWRYVQILAVNTENGVDLVYSYMLNGHMDNVVVSGVTPDAVVPSISDLYLEAFVCENEIHDLYGLNIAGIAIDFAGNFYQLSQKAPMTVISPEQLAAREKAKKIAAAKAAKEAKAAAAAQAPQEAAPAAPAAAAASTDEVARERMANLDPEKAAKVAAALEARRKKAEAEAAAAAAVAVAAEPAPAPVEYVPAPEPAPAPVEYVPAPAPMVEPESVPEPAFVPVPEPAAEFVPAPEPSYAPEAAPVAVAESVVVTETVAPAPLEPVVPAAPEPVAPAVEAAPYPVAEPAAPVIPPFQSTPIAPAPVPEPEPVVPMPTAPAAIPGAEPMVAPTAAAPVIPPFQSTPAAVSVPNPVSPEMAAQQAALEAKLDGLDPEKAAKLRVLLEAQMAKSGKKSKKDKKGKKAKKQADLSPMEGEGE